MTAQIDVTYITSKIIGLTFPDDGQDQAYKSSMQNVAHMLTQKHADRYMIINLSERKNDMHQQHKQVIDFGWPENLAPPLERLCNICKSLDQWLQSDQRNIVVLHCKGGLSRLAIVLTAFINYCRISPTKEQKLDERAMQSYCDEKLSQLMQPSQYRYVHYFSGLLSGAIRINNSPLFLHQIIIRGVPDFDGNGGCYPYFKIYQGMQPVYMSGVLICSVSQANICVTIEPALQLRSDIIIKCFNRSPPQFKDRGSRSEMIFRCQFHTCAIVKDSLKFMKQDLDVACNDYRFPNGGQFDLVFSTNQSIPPKHMYECLPSERNVLIGSSNEPLGRCNSYENFAGPSDDIPGFISTRSMNGEVSSTKIRHNQQQYQRRNEYDDILRKDRETLDGYNIERSGRGGVEIRSEQNQANYSTKENYTKREEQKNRNIHSQQNNWDQRDSTRDFDQSRDKRYEEQRRLGENRFEGRYNEERMTNDFSKMHVTDTVQSHNDFVRSNTLRSSKQGRSSLNNDLLQPPSTRGGGSITPSRETALLMPQALQKDGFREQNQLDDILQELLDKPDNEVIRPDHRYSEGSGPLAKHGPVQGTMVNEGDNIRSVLTWSTDRRGDTKSAGVTRNTIAAPEPGVKMASETSRYREVSAPGTNVNLFADRMATEESYEKKLPGYRESKQSKVTSQAWIQDNSKSVPFDDFSDGTASQKSRNRTYSTDEFGKDDRRRYVASDTEEMNTGWLEKQRGRVRSARQDDFTPEERKNVRNVKGEPMRRKELSRAQSDMEDGEING